MNAEYCQSMMDFPYLKICIFRGFGAFLPKVDLDHN